MWWPAGQNRKWSAAILAMCAVLPATRGQTPAARAGGQGEVSFQGYYLGGSQQSLLNITGAAVRFQQFIPSLGFLSGSLQGYGSQDGFETGENFAQLRGVPWAGHYWTVTGGDFRSPSSLVEFPFTNIFVPEINARGVNVQAVHGDTQYAFFAGQETMTAGARVVYRIASPQIVMGASVVRKVSAHLSVGARVMQFSASPQSIGEQPYLFPTGRTAPLVRTLAVQSLFTPWKRLKIYGEASQPSFDAATPHITSTVAGIDWESAILTLRTNYVRQGNFFFPLAGYFAGDRRGPFAEARLRPWKGLELFASASEYRNNLERDPDVPVLASRNNSVGLSASLPGKISISGQLSTVHFSSTSNGPDGPSTVVSDNRQISAALSRAIGRQTVQLDWRDIVLDTPAGVQRQRSSEAGDTVQFHHFSVGGSVRYQEVAGVQNLGSLFFHGLGQVNAGPVMAYANLELGNDLANQTVFSTEAYRNSVVGVSSRLPRGWSFQTEMFRNQLNFELNEENVFLLQNGTAFAGLSAAAGLTNFTQWSLFFRISKQFQWGAGLPSENAPGDNAGRRVSLTGSIDGYVHLKTLAGTAPAGNVVIKIDRARAVVSGPDGHYVLEAVPEGAHEVELSPEELPADLDAGDPAKRKVAVQPRKSVRADFDVFPLSSAGGRVTSPESAALEDIVIRLEPGDRYTRTGKDGSFTFYNLREGDYELSVDSKSLPEGAQLQGPNAAVSIVRVGTPAAPVEFHFEIVSAQKPIRKVLDRK